MPFLELSCFKSWRVDHCSLLCLLFGDADLALSFDLSNWLDHEDAQIYCEAETDASCTGVTNSVFDDRVLQEHGKEHEVVHDDDQFHLIEHVHFAIEFGLSAINMSCHDDKQSAAEEQREHLQPQVSLGKDYTQG